MGDTAAAEGSAEAADGQAAAQLLAWFDTHQRLLPWRRDRDPYRILVSELMLQQTRVEVVVPYFERFVGDFPTVEALASATAEDVLVRWSGLGYYRRARYLHAAAQELQRRGVWPRRSAELRTLPGVGAYTAAAVASMAFGENVPVLDGNVRRVMARLLGQEETVGRRAEDALRAGAAGLLVAARSGDSNQALMELGATVCLPRLPRCAACPLAADCRARQNGNPERFPAKLARRATITVVGTIAVVSAGGRWLLARRPLGALLAGQWELPWVAARGEDAPAAFGERYGLRVAIGDRLAAVRHAVTHHALELEVRAASLLSEAEIAEPRTDGEPLAFCLVDEAALAGLATGSLVKKALRRAGLLRT